MYELALFSGAGGGILASKMLGIQTVCAIEIEEYPRGVLMQRQNDGILPAFPIWDNVETFLSDNPECADFIKDLKLVRDNLIISGGFPCQDISSAGKGAGINGENSGLWREYARMVCEIRPALVFVENSPLLTSRGLGTVLKDFSEMGYNAIWGVLGASDIGANHH
ncbi:DNA methyltransferase, partial [Nostoc linckia z4]